MTTNPLRAARGTTATLNTRALKEGELAYNTDTEELHVGDGSTLGGRPISSEVDGDDIDVTATGSTTARSLADRFAEEFHVVDYGAVGDGVTNDAPAILLAIAAAVAKGGGDIIFEPKTYAIAAEIAITTPSIHLYGRGGDKVHTVGTAGAQAATELKWTGSSGGTMISFTSPTGASNQIIFGGGVEDIYLNGDALAGVGIKIRSLWAGRFRDLLIFNCTSAQVDVGVVATLGESESTQHCTFEDMNLRATVLAPNAHGFLLDGDYTTTANTSLCRFDRCSVFVYDGTAYNLQNCDNNFFESCRAYVTGSGFGVVMHGSNAAVQDIARNNVFMHFSGDSTATIVAKGTSSYTYPSYGNRFFCIDNDNNVGIPTIETGASCYWDRTDAITGGGQAFVKLAIGDVTTNADDARDDQTTESLIVRNNSENHMLLAKGDGTLPWREYIQTSTGDLVFAGGAGTRHVQFAFQSGGGLIPNADNIFTLGITGTAWNKLWLGSGGAIDFAAGDVTLTHSADLLTLAGGRFSASQAAAATTATATFINTNNNASVSALRLEGDRATFTANDEVYASFVLSDNAGNQDEFCRISAVAQTITSGAEVGQFHFSTLQAGAFAVRAQLGGTFFRPFTNDGMTLGNATLAWADLFLASGAVINFDNGDVTITHSANALTFGGAANGYVFNQHILSAAHIKAHQSTAIPAGGTAGAGFTFSSATNFGVFFGSGAPTLSAAQGSLYLRSDGSSTSTRAYINTDGGTTWTNLVTGA
jgi:hypothetical protein